MSVPDIRVRPLNPDAIRADGEFVLYWMTANRRTRYSFSLQRAVEHCEALGKPLLIFEALRCGYRWASDRIHRFVLQGMADNRAALVDAPAASYIYVEPEHGHGGRLLESLAARACVVVTDDFPCFFIPRMLRHVAPKLGVLLEAVDSNGLMPMRAADKVYPTAYGFRRFLHKTLPQHLGVVPDVDPLAGKDIPMCDVPDDILARWPAATDELLEAGTDALAALPIDHDVGPASFDGGPLAAERVLKRFLNQRLAKYAEARSLPDEEAASGLSPYLHFGHLSAHEVFEELARREEWSIATIQGQKPTGKRAGWWGMSESAESFLDELITWRELGYNMCSLREDYARYESLPDWARATLEEHEPDPRDPCYPLEVFESATTHDPLWNAAQTQLVREGRMHNYLRMLWGKKILHWSSSPRDALTIMIHLNNKYAVDGRNPNSYSGIFWCLGRYDRAWGPERPIFGKIRYMSSENTARKFSVAGYLGRYGAGYSAERRR